jgi:hypothetical protein
MSDIRHSVGGGVSMSEMPHDRQRRLLPPHLDRGAVRGHLAGLDTLKERHSLLVAGLSGLAQATDGPEC